VSVSVEVIKQMLVEEVLDGRERTRRSIHVQWTVTIETHPKINKKNRNQ
jgi:hypothetical protein